ncbi:fimbrial protein [Enterobacter cloacae subsp. cloacae]|uniref:fimbrial protein n=1 Tax=Enterobacter cloacae TaxID=550 RepID=UPI000A39594E|nr:fimbrial protein [Enterobacter cloacae]MBW4217890.1 fimbrial protein [Enterobacter cloacae subsp. cloacae]
MTEVTGWKRWARWGILSVLSVVTDPASAGTASATLRVNVTVIAEPCTINNGRPIQVNFGDNVLTTNVDGSNYTRPVDYTLDCVDATSDGLKMTISGTVAGFDDSVLQASQTDLGIKLLSNGTALPLNQALNFNRNAPPVLEAVPVKAPGSKLSGGLFTATATMTVEYQ